MSFWDFIAWFFWIFVFVAYLMVIFTIIGDLFRDHELSGWWKAVWMIFLVFLPFLTALVYLIARGKGMAARQAAQVRQLQAAQDAYIRHAAGSVSSSEEIARAKQLLDAGTVSQAEFDTLKAKALAHAAA